MKQLNIPLQIKKVFTNINADISLMKLDKLGKFRRGKGISKSQLTKEGFKCITYGMLYTNYNGIIDKTSTYIDVKSKEASERVFYNEILFPSSGESLDEIGKASVIRIKEDLYAGGDIIIFTPNENINPLYLSYVLNSDFYKVQTRRFGQGHSVVHIYADSLKNIIIPVPKFEVQKKIAEILSAWDDAIEIQEKIIKEKEKFLSNLILLLVKNKKSLVGFKSKWNKVKLSDVYVERKEYEVQSEEYELYSLTIEDGVTEKTDRYERGFLVKDDQKRYKVTKYNDLVFNPQNLRYGAISLNKTKKPVLVSPIYSMMKIKNELKYDVDYFNFLLTNDEMIRYYDSIAEGTLVERMAVKPATFLNLEFYVPPYEEQLKISKILLDFEKQINLHEASKEVLKIQKQGLMQQLITGKIRVNLN